MHSTCSMKHETLTKNKTILLRIPNNAFNNTYNNVERVIYINYAQMTIG